MSNRWSKKMKSRVHQVHLEDYDIYSREELCNQIDDCRRAVEELRSEKWRVMKEEFVLKEETLAAIENEQDFYEIEEMKLQAVLDARDNGY
jgi:hypothetical protein